MTFLILETTHYKTSLVVLERAIKENLDLLDPLEGNGSDVRVEGGQDHKCNYAPNSKSP